MYWRISLTGSDEFVKSVDDVESVVDEGVAVVEDKVDKVDDDEDDDDDDEDVVVVVVVVAAGGGAANPFGN